MEHQAEYHIDGIEGVKKAPRGYEYLARVRWLGMDVEEATWEPISRVLEDAPVILKKELKKLCQSKEEKEQLRGRYGFRVSMSMFSAAGELFTSVIFEDYGSSERMRLRWR